MLLSDQLQQLALADDGGTRGSDGRTDRCEWHSAQLIQDPVDRGGYSRTQVHSEWVMPSMESERQWVSHTSADHPLIPGVRVGLPAVRAAWSRMDQLGWAMSIFARRTREPSGNSPERTGGRGRGSLDRAVAERAVLAGLGQGPAAQTDIFSRASST